MNTVTIIAPGLIGGSILKTLRKKNPALKLKTWTRDDPARHAIQAGNLADEISDTPAAAAAGSDLVILCSPVHAMEPLTRQLLPALSPDTIVTDVGSVKTPVHTALAPLLAGKAHWTGSHPMAGSEQSGIWAARDNLFDNTVTIMTPAPDTPPRATAALRHFWENLGTRVVTMTPEEHDTRVAQISHLPHLLAALLVNNAPPQSLAVAGPGFRDTTRIAAGSPEMWAGILLENRAAVTRAMKDLQEKIRLALETLEQGDQPQLTTLLTAAQKRRHQAL